MADQKEKRRTVRRSVPTLDPTAGRAPAPAPTPAPSPAASASIRSRRRRHLPALAPPTSRVTVDVATEDHRALKRTTDDIADALDVGSVAVGQVIAAMAHLISADADLRESVTAYLRDRVRE